MKKKILGGIAIMAIAAVAAFNASFNTESNDLSIISLANMEALAQESGGAVTITCGARYGTCWRYKPYPGWGSYDQCEFSGYQRDYCG